MGDLRWERAETDFYLSRLVPSLARRLRIWLMAISLSFRRRSEGASS